MSSSRDHEQSTCTALEWLPVESADFDRLSIADQWVLIATSDGRITVGKPADLSAACFTTTRIWVAGSGSNCSDPRWPTKFLPHSVTHWMPLPAPPSSAKQDERDSSRDGQK